MTTIRQRVLGALPAHWRRQLRLQRLLFQLRDQRRKVTGQSHGLPGELIVTLTSYPARFEHLHLTIESLLNQSVRTDRVILWVAEADRAHLPQRVLRLNTQGLEIRTGADLRSYKKLVFALEAFPSAFLVTADDDLFYPPDWLAPLVQEWRPGRITCRRAHRILAFDERKLTSYRQWEKEVEDASARLPSADLLPTTGAGVLFPPGALHPAAVDSSLFMALSPNADDLWFYMMARKAGTPICKAGGHFELVTWPDSQEVALFNDNLHANDEQYAKLVAHFGHPANLGPR